MIYRFCNNNARDLLKETDKKKRKFEGKIIVITGASSGIGRQAALDFVNEGAGSIVLIARSESKLLELKRTLQVVNEPKAQENQVPAWLYARTKNRIKSNSCCGKFAASRNNSSFLCKSGSMV